jgi:small subunit ribosomal protein S7
MAYKKFTASAQRLAPDPKFHSKLVSKFINCFMIGGKKIAASTVFYDAMEQVAKKVADVPPLEIFEKAIQNVKPLIEVRSKRVGGANYQVPMQVNSRRQLSLAIRWMREAVRSGKGAPTARRLGDEILAAYKGDGAAMQTRENVHRMAEANKAFAHFAW